MSEFSGLWKHSNTQHAPWLGSTTLSQLAFPGEGNPNFPWEKSHWDDTAVKSKKKKLKKSNLFSKHTKYSKDI